jgi:hypothetical protein
MVAFSRRHFWRSRFSVSTPNVDHVPAILSILGDHELRAAFDQLVHERALKPGRYKLVLHVGMLMREVVTSLVVR